MIINIPSTVQKALDALNIRGYEAYVVGGCVRDSIMGRIPHDWDICTSALPENMIECFSEYKIIETGIKHGTLTVIIEDESIEITTYRVDGKYTDNRHPDKVTFISNLREDLNRRDFTINALAYNPNCGMVDLFNGVSDIKRNLIRCVGDPDDRFNEDALRILRALRFASTLSFNISESTDMSIHFYKYLLDNIAKERINSELCKLLMGDNVDYILNKYSDVVQYIIPEIEKSINFEQQNPYHIYDVWRHTVKSIKVSDKDIVNRLVLMFHDIGKPLCFTKENDIGHFYGHGKMSSEIAKSVLQRLRFDNETIDTVTALVQYHDADIMVDRKQIKHWLNKIGEANFRKLLLIKRADILAQNPEYIYRLDDLKCIEILLNQILGDEQCFQLKDLEINGKDLIGIGISEGIQIGNVLKTLLEMVIEDKVQNNKDALLIKAKKMS